MFKRITALLLAVLLGLSCAACGAQTPQSEPAEPTEQTVQTEAPQELFAELALSKWERQELLYAQDMGLPVEKITPGQISGSQMAELLDAFVAYAAPEKLDAWRTLCPEARQSADPLGRMDALIYLYLAAYHIGGDYAGYDQRALGVGFAVAFDWGQNPPNWGLFGGSPTALGKFRSQTYGELDLHGAAYYFNYSHISPISAEYLFSIDRENNRFPSEVQPTYAECALAIARLTAAVERYQPEREVTEAEKPYLDQINARRTQIGEAVTDLSSVIRGRTFYVSPNGSDKNDGRSPEKAWASLNRVAKGSYRDGDAVLFERGGQWNVYEFSQQSRYSGTYGGLETRRQVHFGAYGQGAKPVLRGDVPEAAAPENWELHHESGEKKIWKYVQPLHDVNVITFNDGAFWAEEVMPWWDGKESYINPDQSPFILEEALDRDLTFSCLQETVKTEYQMGAKQAFTLYLRCDAGNPAQSFDSIQIPNVGIGIMLSSNATACDLDLRYFTMSGCGVNGSGKHPGGQVFQNLDISWCGGFLLEYTWQCPGEQDCGWQPRIAGGGIALSGVNNVTVADCHFYQVAPMTTIVSISNQETYYGIHIRGNLFEHCGSAGYWADWSAAEKPGASGSLRAYVFEDNMAAYTGDGWFSASILDSYFGGVNAGWNSVIGVGAGTTNEGITIRSNLMFHSSYAMITLEDLMFDWQTPVNSQPTFSGNTYVQLANRPLVQRSRQSLLYYPTEKVMQSILGDAGGTLVAVE